MYKYIDKYIEEIILVVLLALMSIIIGVQVFMRYVLKASLSWSEEIARYMFVWIVYIGISYGVKAGRHIKVDAALMLFSSKIKNYICLLSDLIFMFFAVTIVIYGIKTADKIFTLGQNSPAIGMPMGFLYLAPVVGFALVSFRLVQNILVRINSIKKGEI